MFQIFQNLFIRDPKLYIHRTGPSLPLTLCVKIYPLIVVWKSIASMVKMVGHYIVNLFNYVLMSSPVNKKEKCTNKIQLKTVQ